MLPIARSARSLVSAAVMPWEITFAIKFLVAKVVKIRREPSTIVPSPRLKTPLTVLHLATALQLLQLPLLLRVSLRQHPPRLVR